MFRHIKTLVIGLVVFCVVFTFFPTGSSGNQVVSGFRQMSAGATAQQQGALVAAHSTYMIDPTFDGNPNTDPIVGELRDAIVQLNINICTEYGNGYKADDGTNTLRNRSDGIQYSCDYVEGWYSSFGEAKTRYDAMVSGTASKMYLSCHGSCYFTWNYFWDGSPYNTGSNVEKWICPATGHSTDQSTEVSKRYTSTDEMLQDLQPGDIIWHSCSGCKYHDGGGSYCHSMIYLGDIEIDGHTITHAYRNTGSKNDKNDWKIQPLYDLCASQVHTYYVVSLSRAISYVQAHGGRVEQQPWASDVIMPSGMDDEGGADD